MNTRHSIPAGRTFSFPIRVWRGGIVAAAFVALTLSAMAERPASRIEKKPLAAVPAVRSEMLVNTGWLAAHLNTPGLVILQIGKTDKAYKKDHIPGAHYVAWKDLVVDRNGVPNELPNLEDLVKLTRRLGITSRSHIVVYDDDSGVQAARAYVTLDYLGLGDQTSLLDGQWKKWSEEKRSVSAEVPKPTPSEFTPKPNPGIIVSLQKVRGLSQEKTAVKGSPVALIDARPPAQYSGKTPGEDIKRGGHIPGAVNVFAKDNYVTKENPTFKSVDELRSLYDRVIADPKEPAVTYCRSGVQASLAYFTLKYLGYNAKLYDGSYSQWSSHPDDPIVSEAKHGATPAKKSQ